MKKLLWIILTILAVVFVAYLIVDEPLPEGHRGPEAEALAEKMLAAVGKEAWEQIPFIAWSFRGGHRYVWDKQNHAARIEWGDYVAVLDLNRINGRVEKEGRNLKGEELEEAIQTAWSNWCNDSFWLNAPVKATDPGTVRKVVETETGDRHLLVEYESGGVTPGDAYLWILDEKYLPEAFKMWVSIIPVGGVEATWSGWKSFDGAMIATEHKMGPLEIPIGDVRTGDSPADFELPADYFTSLNQN